MHDDEIIEEIRRHRKAHAASFGYDLKRIVRDLQEQQRRSGVPVVSRPPRPPRVERRPRPDRPPGSGQAITCDICGKKNARVRRVTQSLGRGRSAFLIEGVPVVRCPDCGESYLTAETLKGIERIRMHWRRLAVDKKMPVVRFEGVTEAMNRVVDRVKEPVDPFVSMAAREILKRSEWHAPGVTQPRGRRRRRRKAT